MPVEIRSMTRDEMPAMANLRGQTPGGPWTLTVVYDDTPGSIDTRDLDGADQDAAEQWATYAIGALGYSVDQWQRGRPIDGQAISRTLLHPARWL